METSSLELRESFVSLGEPLYFSAKECRDAITRETARLTWFPIDADREVVTVDGTPNIGGC